MSAWKLFPVLPSFAWDTVIFFLQHSAADHKWKLCFDFICHVDIFRKFSFNNFLSSLYTTDIEFNLDIF